MFRKLTKSFYTKIILVCTLMVLSITASLLYVTHRFIRQQEVNEHLANYNIAISNQSAALSSRLTTFSDFFLPLISNSAAYDTLCEFYLSPNGTLPNESAELLLDTLYTLCSSDNYCCGLLLMTRSGLLYQYDTRYAALIPLELSRTIFRFTPYQLQILSDTQISELSLDLEYPASHMYGVSGTIFQSGQDTVENLGYLIALYSPEEFNNVIADLGLEGSADFHILDTDYNVLYASSGDYAADSTRFLPPLPGEDNPSGNMTDFLRLDGSNYYVSALYQNHYNYFVTYQLPEDAIELSSVQVIVLLIGFLISTVCILLYGFALRSSNHRVRNIKQGMELIGKNNLDYRMPVPAANDEFASIIRSFNRMCDELQRNVEQTYLFEISQRKAELYAMQTSINPHFLYNALEQIRVQILQGKADNASKMLLLLSKMYRYQTKRDLFISIAEECDQMENLINLYSYRSNACDYEFNVESSLKKYGIPKNILQPLIENCFIHGFSPDQEDCMLTITISSLQQNDQMMIHFLLADNGTSITPEKIAEIEYKLSQPVMSSTENNGFALSNVNTRLTLIFGKEAALHPSIGADGGFCIAFTIPPVLPEDLSPKIQ